MKIFVIFILFFIDAYGSTDSHKRSDISPQNECTGQPNGMRVPGPTCNHFILCEDQMGLTLTCRASEPHFDRCQQRCVNNSSVCDVTHCSGDPPATTTTTPSAITTTTPSAITTTTSRFIPPTVPVNCPVPCENVPHTCTCPQKWRCINGVCQCDEYISCPITRAQCMADPQCGGTFGCSERCECIDDNNCVCNLNNQCPFPITQCNSRCGCDDNCFCSPFPTRCFCHESCRCSQPQNCPFSPYECLANCRCANQCVCNGNMCNCNSAIVC